MAIVVLVTGTAVASIVTWAYVAIAAVVAVIIVVAGSDSDVGVGAAAFIGALWLLILLSFVFVAVFSPTRRRKRRAAPQPAIVASPTVASGHAAGTAPPVTGPTTPPVEPPASAVHGSSTATDSDVGTHDAAPDPSVTPLSEPLRLPMLTQPSDWPTRPGVKTHIDPADPAADPDGTIEREYADGLTALSHNEPTRALRCFRAVVEQDAAGTYTSARLLALLLSTEIGDIATADALTEHCTTNAQPDAFARRAIKTCRLELFTDAIADEPAIVLDDCLDQPAVATALALAGQMCSAGNKRAAAAALEVTLTAREARDAQPTRQRARPLTGICGALCDLYLELGEPDAAIDLLSRCTFAGSELWKAQALRDKGLTDAALAVYDDCIREGKKRGVRLEYIARYRKAALLLDNGDVARARRELGRLYADDPTYKDYAGLLDKIKAPGTSATREPIPEQVRYAVWRRDEGRCVQCGSQENLEFDHMIPVSRGGANSERNLQLLCQNCNRAKGATV